MVKIPCAEPGDIRTQWWGKGEGQTEKERRLEDQNNEPISKNPSNVYNNKQKNKKMKQLEGGKAVVQSYSSVKLQGAQLGDKRNIIMWTEGQGKRESRLQD